MTKTVFVDVPPGQEQLFNASVQTGDPFVHGSLQKHRSKQGTLLSEKTRARSLLRTIATLWDTLDIPTKATWAVTSPYSDPTGWKHFLSDCCARFTSGFTGLATPNAKYQVRVGKISSTDEISNHRFGQKHYSSYFLKSKLSGSQAKFRAVQVSENFDRPFEIGLAYKGVLGPTPASDTVVFGALIKHDFQGHSLTYNHRMSLVFNGAWNEGSAILPVVLGKIKSYELYIELNAFDGDFYFDRVLVRHHDQNWAIDGQCDEIEANYVRGLANCQKPWTYDLLPAELSFKSVYHEA